MSVLGVFTGVMAARLLGPKGRGELAAIQAWPSALASLAMLGSSEALVYFSAREPSKRSAYLSAALMIGTVGAVFFSVAGFVAMPWLLSSQNSSVVWGARVFLIQIWMYLLIAMPTEVLRAAGHFAVWNTMRLCPMFLWVGIFSAAWLVGARSAVQLACSYMVVGWLICMPEIFLLRREGLFLTIPRRRQLKEICEFGLPAVGTLMPRMLNLRLDQILMAGFLPAAALGEYVVAVAWSGASTPMIHGVSAIVVPKLAAETQHSVGVRGSELARMTRVSLVFAALSAVALLVMAPAGIRFFFGARFTPAIPAARLLALAGGVAGLNMVLSEGMRGLGRPASVLRAELAALVVTAGGLWLLLGPFGIYGAAIVSLTAYAATTCWLLAEARRITGASISNFLIPGWEDLVFLFETIAEIVARSLASVRSVSTTIARTL